MDALSTKASTKKLIEQITPISNKLDVACNDIDILKSAQETYKLTITVYKKLFAYAEGSTPRIKIGARYKSGNGNFAAADMELWDVDEDAASSVTFTPDADLSSIYLYNTGLSNLESYFCFNIYAEEVTA